MSLSCYIHIPYCKQKCLYCDFTTFTKDKLPAPEVYTNWIKQEIEHRHQGISERNLKSIYFGGGTPSFIPAQNISSIINYLKNYFLFQPDIEISIEVNPGTLTERSFYTYLSAGVNRFSLGVQTFREDLLKKFNRGHSVEQTKNTLKLLQKNKVRFSGDLLFALNKQTIKDLKKDLETLLSYNPHHLSAYYMTLPRKHILQKNRPSESLELKMFYQIRSSLKKAGFDHYEISNFARKNFYSKQTLAYLQYENYWGLGLSAHSFLKSLRKKVRFWNPKSINLYSKQVKKAHQESPYSLLPEEQKEVLLPHEALTDFCHTALRTRWGISLKKLKKLFSEELSDLVLKKLKELKKKNLIKEENEHWRLPFSSWLISNSIFQEITFLKEELDLN